MSWLLLHTRTTSESPQVVQASNAPKGWTSAMRAVQSASSAVTKESGRRVLTAAESCLADGGPKQMRTADSAVCCQPVQGPFGHVSGVLVGIGTDNADLGAPPGCAGFEFDADRRLVYPNEQLIRAANPTLADRDGITLPEVLRYVEIPELLNLVESFLANPDTGPTSWSGMASVDYRGHRATLAIHLSRDPGSMLWRGLLHEVRGQDSPGDSLASATLSAVSVLGGQASMCVMDLAKARLIQWVTDPPAGIQWKGQVDDRDTPHPDDVARIWEAVGRVFTDGSRREHVPGVRMRRRRGGWTVVDCTGVVIVGAQGEPQLALISMMEVGESDAPDPTEAGA